jgi:hypothetical protein
VIQPAPLAALRAPPYFSTPCFPLTRSSFLLESSFRTVAFLPWCHHSLCTWSTHVASLSHVLCRPCRDVWYFFIACKYTLNILCRRGVWNVDTHISLMHFIGNEEKERRTFIKKNIIYMEINLHLYNSFSLFHLIYIYIFAKAGNVKASNISVNCRYYNFIIIINNNNIHLVKLLLIYSLIYFIGYFRNKNKRAIISLMYIYDIIISRIFVEVNCLLEYHMCIYSISSI